MQRRFCPLLSPYPSSPLRPCGPSEDYCKNIYRLMLLKQTGATRYSRSPITPEFLTLSDLLDKPWSQAPSTHRHVCVLLFVTTHTNTENTAIAITATTHHHHPPPLRQHTTPTHQHHHHLHHNEHHHHYHHSTQRGPHTQALSLPIYSWLSLNTRTHARTRRVTLLKQFQLQRRPSRLLLLREHL